jgi:hypothetical protein
VVLIRGKVDDMQIPVTVEAKTFSFRSQAGSMRNLQIRNRFDGQVFDVQCADAPELADSLEALAAGIRASYGITK